MDWNQLLAGKSEAYRRTTLSASDISISMEVYTHVRSLSLSLEGPHRQETQRPVGGGGKWRRKENKEYGKQANIQQIWHGNPALGIQQKCPPYAKNRI